MVALPSGQTSTVKCIISLSLIVTAVHNNMFILWHGFFDKINMKIAKMSSFWCWLYYIVTKYD